MKKEITSVQEAFEIAKRELGEAGYRILPIHTKMRRHPEEILGILPASIGATRVRFDAVRLFLGKGNKVTVRHWGGVPGNLKFIRERLVRTLGNRWLRWSGKYPLSCVHWTDLADPEELKALRNQYQTPPKPL